MNRSARPRAVAVVSQHYPPEGAACANRMEFFAAVLRERGFTVAVFTSLPSYPLGRISDAYRGRVWCSEERDGVRVHRTWSYAHPRRTPLRRLAAYFSFAILSLRWLRRVGAADVIVFTSGPMFAGLVARLAARLHRRPLVLDVRDLWPDKIWESGARRAGRFERRSLRRLEQRIYDRARVVFGATQGLCDVLRRRVPEDTPVVLVRNTAQNPPGGVLPPRPAGKVIRLVSAGTIGWMQDDDVVCAAFERLLREGCSVDLRVAGWGPRGGDVRHRLDPLPGAAFLGPLARPALHAALAEADIGIVALAASEHNRMAVARRVFDYAAAGLAVVYAGEGEGADLVRDLDAGIVIPPADADALHAALQRLVTDPAALEAAKQSSAALLAGELSDAFVAQRIVTEIERLFEEPPSPDYS